VEPEERILDGRDRVGGPEQPVDVGFCQREWQAASVGNGALPPRDDADLAARLQHGPGDVVERGDLLQPRIKPCWIASPTTIRRITSNGSRDDSSRPPMIRVIRKTNQKRATAG
jgi:hypothetical protein